MLTNKNTPKKPFMIYRKNEDGNDYALIDSKSGFLKGWVDWDGSKFRNRETALEWIRFNDLQGAQVIEILEEVRYATFQII